LSNEIIFVNPTAKPKRPIAAPTPEAPAEVQASQVKRIRIGWDEEGRKGIAAQSEAISLASADKQPQRELDDRLSGRLARVRRSESRSYSQAPSRIKMGRIERYSKLEQLPEQRSLWERLDRQAAQPALEHLTILHSPKAQHYWIADAETGDVFLSQAFTTLKHCHEAAAELGRTFAIAQVLEMRSPETMESLSELVREHWQRERVAGMLG
jgi:hypothetical protein